MPVVSLMKPFYLLRFPPLSDSIFCQHDIKLAKTDTYLNEIYFKMKLIMRLQCKTLVNSISYISTSMS